MTKRVFRWGLVVSMSMGVACSGTDEDVTLQNPNDPSSVDDTAPPPATYDPALTYTTRSGITANHSSDRFRFDVAAYRDDAERANAAVLHPSHAAFLAAHPNAIPSVQTVGTYLKQLDDTIYAGVEHAVQRGLEPTILPKRSLLEGALGYLVEHRSPGGDEALAVVAAALRLGGAQPSVPPDLEASVQGRQNAFVQDVAASKPFGFYTWSDELRGIWQQDRLLQKPFASGEAACALAQAIGADSARKDRYQKLVALYSRLTNPLHSSLVDLLGPASSGTCPAEAKDKAFLSSSRTVEVALFEKLYPAGIPANADLMKDLVDAIRKGAVDLAPRPEDGWYQHQEFALETLLVTDKSEERGKIAFMAKYKKRLQEAFETMLVQHRETHAKQADVALTSVEAPHVPEFRAEPLATVYVRHARSYVFLEAALDEVLGRDVLDRAKAVGDKGEESDSLRARIHRARDLFYGLYLVSGQDLGLRPKLDAKGDPEASTWPKLAQSADEWLGSLAKDPIAGSDVRVMIPIASLDGGRARYWAVVGVRTTLASYSYLEGSDTSAPKSPADEARIPLPTEQFLQVTSSATPLSREEFRALCDQNKTAEAIQKALEAR